MSYEAALIAAGARVIAFETFGSFQGEWIALVHYKGEFGWVQGSYGSCSHCDAIQAFQDDFGYSANDSKIPLDEYQEKLAAFGVTYLDTLLTQQQIEQHVNRNIDWDSDAQEMVDFVTGDGKDIEERCIRLALKAAQ